MKKTLSILALSLSLLVPGMLPAAAEEAPQAGATNRQESGMEKEYLEFRDKLLHRYDPLVEKLNRAESGYVSALKKDHKSGGMGRPASGGVAAPWWGNEASRQINAGLQGVQGDVVTLFSKALQHSSQVKVFTDLPLIRETSVQEAEGPFDFRVFADGRLADIDEPVGDDLKTGGPLRYEEQSKSIEYGVKKKFITGTEVELKQSIGDMDTNSVYFNPEDQARTGTHLTIRQPLLKGFGIDYQETPLNLARLDSAISNEELRRQVESHLLEVVRAYWGLYLERTLFLQKRELARKTADILKKMEGRSKMDVQPSLLARAKSLVQAHELGAMQAEYAMRNAQSRINALVNDPELLGQGAVELVTGQLPVMDRPANPVTDILQTALDNRPEIAQSVRHIQAAILREKQTKNELRPDLDFFFDTYVKGLDGDYEYGDAYDNQFSEGDPSYLLGLRLEYPLGNNAAKARNLRKRLEMRQLMHQLDVTVENVLLEAQISHREMDKYYESMIQSYQIMEADKEEIKELNARIDYLLAQGEPYGDLLYRLLDANERLTKSEEVFSRSELTYNLALYNLYRAMGVLVGKSDVAFTRDEGEDDLPVIRVSKQGRAQ